MNNSNSKSNNYRKHYNNAGIVAEEYVIKRFNLTKSSPYDDVNNDIDGWEMVKHDDSPTTFHSVSIKSVEDRFTNFAVEIERFNRDNPSIKRDSWFRKGKAEWYYIARFNRHKEVTGDVWIIKTSELKDYVARNMKRLRVVESKGLDNSHKKTYNGNRVVLVPWETLAKLPSTLTPAELMAKELEKAKTL